MPITIKAVLYQAHVELAFKNVLPLPSSSGDIASEWRAGGLTPSLL